MLTVEGGDKLITSLRPVVAGVVRRYAPIVDREARFPTESVEELRALGLLGYFIPAEFGGPGGDLNTYVRIASLLGEECLSTAVIWAMHCQQVDVLVNQDFEDRPEVLRRIASEQVLVASVTTEADKGGTLLRANSPVTKEDGVLRIVRDAPIVSCGRQAEYFLMTMKSPQHTNAAALVLVERGDGNIEVTGDCRTMGMRGTQSCSMSFDVTVAPHRVVADPFRDLAVRTMIPVGHIGWAASWLGAAKGAYHRVLSGLRVMASRKEKNLDSDLLRRRLADARVSLDLVEALLGRVTQELESLRRGNLPQESYEDITFNIGVNNIKVAAARLTFSVVDELIEIAGLFRGYFEGGEMGLERVFRDLRSASLMYHNDRLLDANGHLIFVEHTRLQTLWKKS